MIRYGKTTQSALAAMSRLAEAYADREQLSSGQIAEDRDLSQALVAKLLTQLAAAGLVHGARGPGGGYALARPPKRIALADIAAVFEQPGDNIVCPFGPNWCGTKTSCPLHDDYVAFTERFNAWLKKTNLAVFNQHPAPK